MVSLNFTEEKDFVKGNIYFSYAFLDRNKCRYYKPFLANLPPEETLADYLLTEFIFINAQDLFETHINIHKVNELSIYYSIIYLKSFTRIFSMGSC